ncbi:SAM-dependent methyltransferase [Cellulomonas fimi]|uniref:Methyltransferase type 12 n=1 Tax=Cellulomonas fimi (strain ATCC 484 / DSM 20113 / JCM 1341 / CCUG 24087 / LMG 16345 / NBRC 15513 / NCIMB 8980 / NCTC 7547 / NRS-133) TaxID=590998 RepID=F4H3L2_CELFA|nr:class I SAM-dependent methyltransferase [Cellulomonas fimi]AEE47678.1 Methyltransferase type 12 [Cellulomonas fimi ATCC 484]NNH07433.1 methyltransferase domain-containing protein [Cellulomonas fimi]VEH36779.1 Mg-protoporphyrin IX methyl transferase [Cellulomonas fimi]
MTERPAPFSAFTTPAFWDDPHVAQQMLACHLDPGSALASRPHDVIARSVGWMVDELGLVRGSRVLDLGCGPGLYASRLARRGVVTHGVDVSRLSVAHAREVAAREALPATFDVGDYLEADLGGPYDAALLVYEDFCVLSPEQRGLLLGRTFTALRPGGAFVMDVTADRRFDEVQPGVVEAADLDGGFWADPPYLGTHETWTYPEEHLVLDRYTIATDRSVRQFWNWMQCLTPAQVAAELATGGFGPPDLWGDLTGAPYDPDARSFAVVARR